MAICIICEPVVRALGMEADGWKHCWALLGRVSDTCELMRYNISYVCIGFAGPRFLTFVCSSIETSEGCQGMCKVAIEKVEVWNARNYDIDRRLLVGMNHCWDVVVERSTFNEDEHFKSKVDIVDCSIHNGRI